jgi:hypothetical protein
MSAKSTGRSGSRSIAKSKPKSGVRASGMAKGRATGKTKRGTASRGLVKSMSKIKGKSPLKSTSETRAKRASSSRGTNRRVNASTKPSFGRVDISEIQRSSVDERLSPHSDKPYTGADAFKPDAQGAETLMSAPPRKPIRQSRSQVGLRHH